MGIWHTTILCNTLQHAATRCHSLRHSFTRWSYRSWMCSHVESCHTCHTCNRHVTRFTRAIDMSQVSQTKQACFIMSIMDSAPIHSEWVISLLNESRTWTIVYKCNSWRSVRGGEDAYYAWSCTSLSTKEPPFLELFCGKWPVQMRHPMTLRHPVFQRRSWTRGAISHMRRHLTHEWVITLMNKTHVSTWSTHKHAT